MPGKSTLKLLLPLVLLCSAAASAATPSANTRLEIQQLFTALQSSGCQFSRNGSWYDAAKASAHLQRKYDALVGKGMISTTESFITLAASKSSMSGQPYQVRCGQAPAMTSQAWFLAKLKALRAH